jgi:hypothetical protein
MPPSLVTHLGILRLESHRGKILHNVLIIGSDNACHGGVEMVD